jgi:tetratricopeptide (TPR) repeat protein
MLRPLHYAVCLALTLASCGPSGYPPATPKDFGALERPVKRLVDQRIAAVEAAPADARAHALLGAAYHANGLWLPAAESFAQAAELDPNEPLWPYYGARGLLLLSRAAEARDRIQRAIDIDSRFAQAHYVLGWMQLDEGDLAGARASFQRARELEPRSVDPLVGLAMLALDEGDAVLARELATQALEVRPGYRQARFVHGSALVALGNTARGRAEMEAGADSLDSLTANMPTSFSQEMHNAQVNRAEVLSRASQLSADGDPARALALLDQLTKDFPNDALIRNNRGLALQNAGRVDEAIVALETAARLDDRLSRTWGNLARLYLHVDRIEDAETAAAEAVELDDQNHLAWSALSVARRKQGDLNGALQAARRAVALAPEVAEYQSALGNVFASAGQLQGALEPMQRAAELEPHVPQYELAAASVLIGLGRFDEARDALARARATDPQVPGLRQLEDKLATASGR